MKKSINLFAAITIVAGSIIGSGIFIVSADITRNLGNSFYLIFSWVIAGILTLIAALCYGELAGMMPRVGGQYVYLKEAYNPLMGFLYGWTMFLVIQTGTIAAVAVAFAKFTGVLIPAFGENNILLKFNQYNISASQILAIASIFVITFINYRGIRNGKIMQVSFTVTKLIAIAGLIILGLIVAMKLNFWKINFSNFWEASSTTVDKASGILSIHEIRGIALFTAIGISLVGTIFSFEAWNNVTFIASEVKNPKRNLPLSLFWGVLIVTVIYILTNLAYLGLLPLHGDPTSDYVTGRGIQFANSDRVGVAAAYQIFGDYTAIIMALLIMISTFGANNGLILSGARVYYAMANDGLFFKSVARLNKFKVPGIALVFQGIWASILCVSGKYGDLLDYVVFTVLIFYVLTILGLFILRVKKPQINRPYKTFGYPFLPVLYIIIALSICIDLLIYKPFYTWPGLLIVIFGIPVYFIFKNKLKNRII